ncbi:TetR/AcrR family transcriptional regulator [Actinoplanes sp. CA-015351]|uniref:TetR/AcrR family transcriptional regulator n=1 Tax=Actinoplanes sp. CA-015351 TaxID=3239897 RepID=UPI003D998ACB
MKSAPGVRKRRRLLDIDLIVDSAIALMDETGTITMADLANRLGSSPAAIYRHVDGRNEILILIRNRVLEPVGAAVNPAAPWTEQIAAWLRSLREHLGRHPRLVPLLTAQHVTSTTELVGYARVIDVLGAAGFPDSELILWTSVLDEFAIGSALDLSAPDEVWQTDDSTPAPLIAALQAAPKGRARVDAAFELGVQALIAGMEKRLQEVTKGR